MVLRHIACDAMARCGGAAIEVDWSALKRSAHLNILEHRAIHLSTLQYTTQLHAMYAEGALGLVSCADVEASRCAQARATHMSACPVVVWYWYTYCLEDFRMVIFK